MLLCAARVPLRRCGAAASLRAPRLSCAGVPRRVRRPLSRQPAVSGRLRRLAAAAGEAPGDGPKNNSDTPPEVPVEEKNENSREGKEDFVKGWVASVLSPKKVTPSGLHLHLTRPARADRPHCYAIFLAHEWRLPGLPCCLLAPAAATIPPRGGISRRQRLPQSSAPSKCSTPHVSTHHPDAAAVPRSSPAPCCSSALCCCSPACSGRACPRAPPPRRGSSTSRTPNSCDASPLMAWPRCRSTAST